MRKRKRKLSSSVDMTSITDHSIKKSIIGYTLNLLNRVGLNKPLLTQAIFYLPVNSRVKLVDLLFTVVQEDNKAYNHFKELHDEAEEDILEPSNLSSTIMRIIYKKRYIFKLNDARKHLIELLNNEIDKLNPRPSTFDRKLDELGNIFRLSTSDIIMLRLLYLVFSFSNEKLNEIFDNKNYHEFTRLASIATGLSPIEIRKSLRTTGVLVSSKIIDSIDHTGNNFVSIDDSIAEYLTGLSEKSIL